MGQEPQVETGGEKSMICDVSDVNHNAIRYARYDTFHSIPSQP